jgi:hypothetical protein
VNPDILPREYGGKTHTVDECIELWRKELEQNRASLLQLDQLNVAGVSPTHELCVRGSIPRRIQK